MAKAKTQMEGRQRARALDKLTSNSQLKLPIIPKRETVCEMDLQNVAYICPFCPEAIFEESGLLIEHLQGHSNVLPLRVTSDALTTKKGDDKTSSGTHSSQPEKLSKVNNVSVSAKTKRRPYANRKELHKCSQCPSTFADLSNLRRHRKTHIQTNRPWKCSVCYSFFATLNSVRVHESMVHGKVTLAKTECTVCGKKVSHMKKHMLLHNPETPHRCQVCSRGFKRKDYFKFHMKSFHSNSEVKMSGNASSNSSSLAQLKRSENLASKRKQVRRQRSVGIGMDKSDDTASANYPNLDTSTVMETEETKHAVQDGVFKCPHCSDVIFEEGQSLIEHFMEHKNKESQIHTELNRNMDELETDFESRQNVQRARKKKMYKCSKCPFAALSSSLLKFHMGIHENPSRPWKCTECPSYFNSFRGVRMHTIRIHKKHFIAAAAKNTILPEKVDPDKIVVNSPELADTTLLDNSMQLFYGKCAGENSITEVLPKSLVEMHIGTADFKCPFCDGIAFMEAADLIQHLSDQHEKKSEHESSSESKATAHHVEELKAVDANIAPCNVLLARCDDEYMRLGSKRSKIATTSSDSMPIKKEINQVNDNACSVCKKTFKFKSMLKVHLRTHTGEKPYKCSVCIYSTAQHGNLKPHMIKCHGVRYKTPVNTPNKNSSGRSRSEKTKVRLNNECTVCRKTFSSASAVQVHLRIHTGQKPYQCKQCGDRFAQVTSLNYHVGRHHTPAEGLRGKN